MATARSDDIQLQSDSQTSKSQVKTGPKNMCFPVASWLQPKKICLQRSDGALEDFDGFWQAPIASEARPSNLSPLRRGAANGMHSSATRSAMANGPMSLLGAGTESTEFCNHIWNMLTNHRWKKPHWSRNIGGAAQGEDVTCCRPRL